MTDEAVLPTWVKPLIGSAAAIGTLAAAVGGFISYRPAPSAILAEPRPFEEKLHEIEVDFRKRIEALEQYQAKQWTFSSTRSAEVDRQIQELVRALDRANDLIEANRSRLDRIVEQRTGTNGKTRRKP